MKSFLACALLLSSTLGAQNVGIGTNTPTASLMISSTMNPQFQIRQTNLNDYARIRMQTGSNRFWDIAAFNGVSAETDRLNLFHNFVGDIMSLTGSGRVGIGNSNPNAPLAFGAFFGKKITLFPGDLGDAGFGIAGNRLQIFSDNLNADVAIGYDAAGVFNERFAFKPNGALALQGNTGQSGQVLRSSGSAALAWANLPGVISQKSGGSNLVLTGFNIYDLPNSTLVLNLPRAAKVLVFMQVAIIKAPCLIGSCASKARVVLYLNGTGISSETMNGINFSSELTQSYSNESYGPEIFELAAGTHTFSFKALNVFNEPQLSFFANALIFEKW